MASADKVYSTTVDGSISIPQMHTEDYITEPGAYLTGEGGRPHSENSGMVNDWHGWTNAMNTLLDSDTVKALFAAAFSTDYVLLPERGYIRNSKFKKDLVCPLSALSPHVDFPSWKRHPTTELNIYRIPCPVGKITLVCFDQASVHGVATGGHCAGWFISAVNKAGYVRYIIQLHALLTRLKADKLTKTHHDTLAIHADPPLSAEECLRLDFVMGSRPHNYSSGKVVQAPHSMASKAFPYRTHKYLSATAFKHIRKKPRIDMTGVTKRLRERGLMDAFNNILRVAPQWNVDPTTYSPYFISKTVGVPR